MLRLKNLQAEFVICLFAAASVSAQIVAYDDEKLTISNGSAPGTLDLDWFGHSGRSYFLAYSPTLADGSWSYLPVIEAGANAALSYGASAPGAGQRFFARTVVVPSSSAHPKTEDFDGDGVSNMDELKLGTDPLASVDSEPNSLPDDFELAYFGSHQNPSEDYDGDGITNGVEFLAGRHPNTSILYGTTIYKYAGEDSTGTVTYMTDYEEENSLSVTYADAKRTRVASISFHPDVVPTDAARPWVFPSGVVPTAATYTMTTDTGDAHTLVFTSYTIVHRGVIYTGHDLLRKIDGMPYSRHVFEDGTVHRVASYLAITSLPLEAVCPTSFPAIIRDFPYRTLDFPDFGTGRNDGPATGYVSPVLGSDGLPVSTLTDVNNFRRICSAESFAAWYRKPDAASVNLTLKDGDSFSEGYYYGFQETHFFPFTDRLGYVGGVFNNLATTRELHAKITYDVSETSANPTHISYASDDDIWIFVNGRLVAEDVGISGVTGDFLLRDKDHGLPTETGTCDLVIFSAERMENNGALTISSSTPLIPIYAYQILADAWASGPVHYDLDSGQPDGMTIDHDSGKLFWDFSGLAPGTYHATIRVSDSHMNENAQEIAILLGEKPAITVQPGVEHVVIWVPLGGSTVLSAEATGTPPPHYQWYYGDVPVPGATSATLTLENIDYERTGLYSVKASNMFGAATSVSVIVAIDESL